MNYRTIIDALEPKLVQRVESRKGGEEELARVRKAKAYDDEGILIPASLRAWLRRIWCSDNPAPCDHLDRRCACEWLSKRQGPGVSTPCPFYERGDDPRGCHSYRPLQSQTREERNKSLEVL